MKIVNKTGLIALSAIAVAIGAPAFAQNDNEPVLIVAPPPPSGGAGGDVFFRQVGVGPGPGPFGTFEYVRSEMVGGNVVKGAPYSAVATTQTTQTLSDGNHIARSLMSKVYRDSEGRTRREETLGAIGPLVPSGAKQLVFLNDPVAGANYVLQEEDKTAQKMKARVFKGPGPKGLNLNSGGPGPAWKARVAEQTQTESLGTQVISGVSAEGTRTTITIPAGQIGNEKPIQIVKERWYSPDLQVVVMSKHSDPRTGDTVYQMTNVTRAEPDPALFQVPSDYTVTEGPAAGAIGFRRMANPPSVK
jgi:hypothetical protein